MTCCDLVDDDSAGIFKPLSQRWCTDVLCLLIFLVYFIVMIALGAFSLGNGNINMLFYPMDYKGQFCGLDGTATANLHKAFYPKLNSDLASQAYLFAALGPAGMVNFAPYTLCVADCPPAFSLSNPSKFGGPTYPGANTTDEAFYNLSPTRDVFSRCLPAIDLQPGLDREICGLPWCTNASLATCLGEAATCASIDSDPSVTTAWEVPAGKEHCCDFRVHEINTQSFLPPAATSDTRQYERQFATYVSSAFAVVQSMYDNQAQILLMGVAAPFAFAFVWFILLFLFAGFLIVLALLMLLGAMLVVAAYFYYKAGWVDEIGVDVNSLTNFSAATSVFQIANDDFPQSGYAVLAVLMTIVILVYVVCMLMWRSSIERCIAIVREVTKVFFCLPFMCAWPLVGVAFYIGILIYGFLIAGFIITQDQNTIEQIAAAIDAYANSTNAVDNSAIQELTNLSSEYRTAILLAIHIGGCIWALYITQCAVYTTLARASAVWFFNHDYNATTGEVEQKGSFVCGLKVVLICAWTIFSRHVGSIAFGAAILTFMTILRLILTTVDYYTKEMQATNCMLKVAMKCVHCCLWCLERTVKFITFYGFIFVAIEGSTFCWGCKNTFSFIIKYPSQVSVNALVSSILSCVISISIPIVCTAMGWIWIDQTVPARPSPLWSAIAIFVMAFVIASAITDVFKCCIDTIFVCAFKDMEEHTPPKFMSNALRSGFGLDDATPSGPVIKGEGSIKPPADSHGTEMSAKM